MRGPTLLLLLGYCGSALACATDDDCSLLGACVAGACVCDAGFTGAACSTLAVLPGPSSLGYHNSTPGVGASWGANAIFVDGLWHAFIAEMSKNCTLNDYGSNSQIIHATAPSLEAPFSKRGVAIAPFAHNPTVRALPDGSGYLLFMIGGTSSAAQRDCGSNYSAGGGRARASDPGASIAVSFSASVWGPWGAPTPLRFTNWNGSALLDCAFTNPSPALLANGSVLLAFQAGYCHSEVPGIGEEMLGVALAPSWGGVYALVKREPILPVPGAWCVAGLAEDPFLFQTARGFALLAHGMCYAVFNALLAVSRDGVAWRQAKGAPYSYEAQFTDAPAQLFWRVERPQLVFNGSRPVALLNGVCGDGLACLEDPGKTWTLLRRLA
jgi:hypothetical protein